MEIEDKDTDLLKKKTLENGDCLDGHDENMDIPDRKSSAKTAMSNGKSINGNGTVDEHSSDGVVENGKCAQDSDVDSNSNDPKNSSMECTNEGNANAVSGVNSEAMDMDNKEIEKQDACEDKDHEEVIDGKSNNQKETAVNNVCDISDEEKSSDVKTNDEDSECGDAEKMSVDYDDCEKKSEEETVRDSDIEEDKSVEKNDSEKENFKKDPKELKQALEKSIPKETNVRKDSMNDDVEIIGESKLIQMNSSSLSNVSTPNVILVSPGMNNFSPNSSLNSSLSFSPGQSMSSGFMMNGGRGGSMSPMSLIQAANAPPKPKSSLDQIELIRWEIQNRLNTRPKYFKPNPSAELGPLAKFLFDIGSNLIKEAVYHELVKIQSKKNEDNTLSEKEKEDLDKLKDIERDLQSSIGHLKLKMKKRCKTCNFQTEFSNVLYHHKQYPHEDNKNLHCAHCSFVTKQPMTFKFHIESEHGIQPRLHDKKAFHECDLCPYENNQEMKLTIHKQRCSKQFRPLFNLHPSCLSGAEINLSLENIFYKPIVPKNLKILQQKHAQQQAALAEARRQQAEVQALVAQKNAAALAAKKHHQRNISTPQRYNSPNTPQFPNRPQGPTMPNVRYNSRSPGNPSRPTVANMLKDKQNRPSQNFSQSQNNNNSAPGGFEVCEICGGYVKDRKALRIHFFYAHRIDLPFNLFDRSQPPLYCATCYVRFWTAQGLRKHIDVHVQEKKVPDGFMGEGVHGKCISCGQLVGNIVVHMRVVHNREIHHYINALMCMFCGASFNSRPNVERHITDVHGTIDIATGAVKVKAKLKSSPQTAQRQSRDPKKGSGGKDNLVKGSVCVLCNLNFGRNVDLTRHCMRMHHTCMKCGMVVIDKASLLKHTCLSSPSGTRDCSMCSETGFHPAYYVKHLRDKHLRKFSITVAKVSAPVIEKWIKRPYPFKDNDPVEISSSEDEEVASEVVEAVPPPKDPESTQNDADSQGGPKKKARVGPASKIGRSILSEEERKGDDCVSPSSVQVSIGGSKRKMSIESTPGRMSKRRK